MEVVFERCAGLDVHKKTVVACRRRPGPKGSKEQEIRTFGTTTPELLTLLDWLQAWEITHVAMESTGEYWKPIFNILEGNLEVWLVNAQHVQAVPGRKTDVKDAEWLADLMQHGLLRPSFIPPRPQRDLRDLTRQRANLVRERTSVVNRLQKVLEGANLKLASVVSDVTGVSATAMLKEILAGHTDPVALAELAYGSMRRKKAELEKALQGRVRPHHCFLIQQHLLHLDFLDEQIETFNQEIVQRLDAMEPPASPSTPASSEAATESPDPPAALTWNQALALVDSLPGVDRRLAEVILAEIGTDMSRFPSAEHLASWAGVAPGNNESAGKRRSSKTPPGDRPLRKALVQGAHAAVRSKKTYLSALYHRLVGRRGKKRALVAVAHSMLISAYHILTRREPYRDLGRNYFDESRRESVAHRMTRRLEQLGYRVTLERQPATG
jgi:transposase